ncbi:hypothetical protein AAF712_004602 [Marasmius tenuissimus]|uniref:MFS general substrate transporter n=1 Tax=Marasmius tenuissimus TaxID=585030 RepID=A0ABR3A6P9_9AGAR
MNTSEERTSKSWEAPPHDAESYTPFDTGSLEDTRCEDSDGTTSPNTDSRFDAWAYLASAWVIDCFVWGLPYSYGVLLDYYKKHDCQNSPGGHLAIIGTLSSGLPDFLSIAILPLLGRYPRIKRKCMIVGLGMAVGGIVGAAFATTAWQIILLQGILTPLGSVLLWFPMMTYLFEWFDKRMGLASGILLSGAGIGGVVFPLVKNALLYRYGRRTTLLSIALAFFVCVLPCFRYLKSRRPSEHVDEPKASLNFKTIRIKTLAILCVANLIQASGNVIPRLYIHTFASDMNVSPTIGSLSIALLNGFSAPGSIFLGYLSDRCGVRIAILLSALGSAVAVFCIWGITPKSVAPILVFAAIHGFLSQGWSALWTRFASISMTGKDPNLASGLLSVYVAGGGLGIVLAGPISTGLIHPWPLTNTTNLAYGVEGYGPVILYTGLALLSSSVGIAI